MLFFRNVKVQRKGKYSWISFSCFSHFLMSPVDKKRGNAYIADIAFPVQIIRFSLRIGLVNEKNKELNQ